MKDLIIMLAVDKEQSTMHFVHTKLESIFINVWKYLAYSITNQCYEECFIKQLDQKGNSCSRNLV